MNITRRMARILRKPTDFYYEIQNSPRSLYYDIMVLIGLAIAVRIISLRYLGFSFQTKEPYEISFFIEAGTIIVLWLSWVVANWAVSVILDGEGEFKHILVSSAFALTPFIVFTVPLTLLTNFMSLEESGFYFLCRNIIILWVILLLLIQVKEIHDFENMKIIWIFVLTVISMFIIWFTCFLVFGLLYQTFNFIVGIVRELNYR
ncbi:MAG TPA: YIP1 family protein [Bacilli bacterium]